MIAAPQDLIGLFPEAEEVPLQKVQDLLDWGFKSLVDLGSEEAKASVERMLGTLLRWNRSQIYIKNQTAVSTEQIEIFQTWVQRRMKREPLAYILGESHFWNETLEVSSACLVPRPETEILVQAALGKVQDRASAGSLMDLGTGSGAIAVALLRELKNFRGTLVDFSAKALELAGRNIERYALSDRAALVQSDLFKNILNEEGRDLIVSNPPYLSQQDFDQLEPELRYEPKEALWGGKDGLDFYRSIVSGAARFLKTGRWLLMELGIHQADSVKSLLEANGSYQQIEIEKDYLGIDRVVMAQKK